MKNKKIIRNLLCRGLRINQQVCSFLIGITFLSMILLLTAYYVYIQIITAQLLSISNILFQKETRNHLSTLSKLELHSTLSVFRESSTQLLSINHMYQMINDDFIIEKPYDCLNNNQYNDSYAYFFSFCYAFCNNTKNSNLTKYTNILKLTSFLTEALRIFDLYLITLIAHKDEEQFFAQNRGYALVNYYPHKRQWYIDHVAKMGSGQEIIVSEPFVSWINVVFITQTTNLSNPEFDGLVGQDLDFSRMPTLNTNTSQFYVVDKKGNIVISDLYAEGVTILIKIYDENYTGFNQTTWQMIQNSTDRMIRIFNTKYEKFIIVMKSTIQELSYQILLIYDDTQYKEEEIEIQSTFEQFQQTYQLIGLITAGSTLLTLLFCQYCFLHHILKDLKYLELMATQKIVYFSKKIFIFQRPQSSSTIKNLYSAYLNLIENFQVHGKHRKNHYCEILESYNYPQKYNNLVCNINTNLIPGD